MGRIWTEESVIKEEEIAFSCLHNRVREAILAIDTELSTARDVEYRQALVKTGYALRNLSLHIQRQESLKNSPHKTSPTVC